jgi:fluoroacetyl-CoA thioesterase
MKTMSPEDEVLGAVGFSTMVVRPGDTCVAMGISDLPILAPSHYMNVMESACIAAVAEYLEPGETTIVKEIEFKVIDSAGIGSEIRGTARCIEVGGRELTFTCDAHEGERHLATALIKRTAVERITFLARTAAQSLISEN